MKIFYLTVLINNNKISQEFELVSVFPVYSLINFHLYVFEDKRDLYAFCTYKDSHFTGIT